ncbi:uncharacterized protein LAJ45_04978 [Morchella importuna]|uniref:uncharacterized protein n=1 Tax=Morchella importuna TaxID=1174673 RepID=UPI001E8ED401|nr:uncharacterized protein LAJ45_04978 [Morchella importuna]KAH8150797.1 hypothetical protein LAJ45_04978 [Morchella importuna]
MSTFMGIVDEFPDIRIDYFRQSKELNARAPLACFLTHIHSDHIQGLENFYGGPFIHCSAATKELLLRLERRAHRWNLAKGVLESRRCQYMEKKNKLKVIPMETPTVIELDGERSIRVTMFDANHCPGAVMFLIEGDGKAVLYTGDVRAEPWWVDYLARHPLLIPYTTGIKRLDKIYLDTTFIGQKIKSQVFAPKREGIRELIETIEKYPSDTIFHLNTWTFGYEDVWVALAAAFKTQIHLSKYHFRLFSFISAPEIYPSGPYLRGYKFGNTNVKGCLTTNPEVRFHSCERKSGCVGLEGKKNVVWITPVIVKIGDIDVHEAGSGDLENQDDLELYEDQLQLLLDALGKNIDPSVKSLLQSARNTRKQALPLALNKGEEGDDIALEELLIKLSQSALGKEISKPGFIPDAEICTSDGKSLPNKITFPYSRHSSYSELRGLVALFRPRDIYPCVVDTQSWDESKTMENLFGDLCEGEAFTHDEMMKRILNEERRIQEELEDERNRRELQSQENLDRAEAEGPIDSQLLKEHLERVASVYRDNDPSSSPPLPRTPPSRKRRQRRISNQALIEAVRLAGSSTASSTPQTSPAGAKMEERQGRAIKRFKLSQGKSEISAVDEPGKTEQASKNKEFMIPGLDSRRGSINEEEVIEAMEAALEIDGRTWWDAGLTCTNEWKYEEEIEL